MSIFYRIISLIICLFIFVDSSSSVEDSIKQADPEVIKPDVMAQRLNIELPPRPWHLADIWWTFAEPIKNFESLSVDISIDRDLSSLYNLYIAPVGLAEINGVAFYGGIQSNINGWTSKKNRKRMHPGQGAIFSRWAKKKNQPIGLEHVRMAANGLCESAGYEGEFASVRRPLNWKKGKYTYSIIKGDRETVKDKEHTWFHCIVRSHETGNTVYIGSLRFEGKAFSYWNKHAAFVEVYSTKKIPKSAIPKINVTFEHPYINGKKPLSKMITVNYNISSSPQCATSKYTDSESVTINIDKMFRREKEKDRQLLYRLK